METLSIKLNLDWRFHLGDVPDADFMGYDDRGWREVNLPHDWAVEHPFDPANASGTGYLPGGTAWYRKHLTLPEEVVGKRVRVTFGGVYQHPQVWINSNYLGRRAYGYTTFTFDLTDFVRPGENVLCVRVEHEQVADSRWYTGSGIYRDVTLTGSDKRCFATNGVFVTTERLDEDGTATLRVRYETLDNCTGAAFEVVSLQGDVLAKATAAGKTGECRLTVPNAPLWSVDTPTLCTLRARAMCGEEETDLVEVPFGIRSIRFDADHGFFLNGVSMKLKGVCAHHDAGCLGAAVPESVWERRIRKWKAAGCNALRTAHNPPDEKLLSLCDRLGMLVMDEAFDEWEGIKNKWWRGHNVYPPKHYGYGSDFPEWHEFDLSAMVLRDRNHPCVILWSIGNEIDYPNDPYVTPLFDEVLGNNDANKPAQERRYDPRKPDAAHLAVVARELVDIVHRLDDSRPVTSALSFPELSTRTGYADALDASGYNYREKFYAEDHQRFPGRVILGSENSHSVEAWRAVRDNEYISGQFLWTGVDFLGECHGWPHRISGAGLLSLAGFEKPLYYQRKAFWTEEPFVKLSVGREGHIWAERFQWAGQEGETLRVAAITNQAEAELFLNGVSLGKQAVSLDTACRAVWEVPYAPGELRVVAGSVEDTLCTAGPAAEIRLQPDKTTLQADSQDVAQVEVTLLDRDGHAACQEEDIHWQLLGDGEILGIENGRGDDLTPYSARHRQTREGRAIVYLRAGTMAGELQLFGFTRGGLKATCRFEVR